MNKYTRQMNILTLARRAFHLVLGTSLMAMPLALIVPKHANAMEECIRTSNSNEPDGGDCVYMKVYTATDDRIVVHYDGNQYYSFYQLRWSRPGSEERQVKLGKGGPTAVIGR